MPSEPCMPLIFQVHVFLSSLTSIEHSLIFTLNITKMELLLIFFVMAGRLTMWGLYCPLPFQIILQNSIFLRSYVHKELAHHSICGPFTSNPFDTNCVISPLLCVPKRDSDEPRVVHDLSFPEGFSVNDGISMNHLDSVYPG